MIKISIGYGEKRQQRQFESISYHCGFEIEDIEMPDNGTLKKKLGQLFKDAREIIKEEQKKDGLVEAEPKIKVEVKPDKKTKPKKEKKEEKRKSEEAPPSVRDNGLISNKQIKYVYSLCRGRGLGNREIEEMLQSEYGVYKIRELDKKTASELISKLQLG